MSDEYQLRKDIDRLSVSIESIKNELIDVGVIDDDMNATQIMGNVVSLRSDLDDFNTSLTTLESSLNTLDTELNGDANTDGLVDYIDALKVYIYGGGSYDYQNPSSTSLKGLLDNLETQIGQIISGDQQLSIDLGTLGEYLDGFNGTLQEFKEELEEEGIDLTNVNEGLINLIYRVNYTKDQVDTHQQNIEDFDDTIGSPSDTGNSTIYGVLNNTVTGLGNVTTSAENITKTLYSGTNGTGTTSSPANDTVMKNLNTATSNVSSLTSKVGTVNVSTDGSLATQITNVKNDIGTASDSYSDGDDTVYGKLNDNIGATDGITTNISHISANLDKYHLPSSDLDWTFIFKGTLNVNDITSLETNYGIPSINYAYKVSTKQWYVKSGSSFITTSTAPSHPIGVCDTLPSSSDVSGSSLSFYTYELSTMNYYTYSSNVWVEQTDLSDFFTQTNVYNNINDGFTSQSDFDVLDGQINDTDGIADTVSGLDNQINDTNGIADTVSGLDSTVSGLESTVGDSSSGLVKTVNGHTVDICSVDVDVNSDLQTQILNIVGLMKDLLVMVGKVDSIEEVSSDIHEVTESGITTYYYEVAEDYPYEFIQITGSNEYYQKVSAVVDNTPMIIWEWCLNPFVDKFQQTTLYDILTYFFTERATPVGVATDYTVLTTDLDTTNISEASIYFYKQFNIVTINYYIQTVSGLNTVEHTVIQTGKIPSAFRPSTPFTQTISDYGGSTIKNAYLKINTDGSMKFKLGANGSIGTYGTLRYIVED